MGMTLCGGDHMERFLREWEAAEEGLTRCLSLLGPPFPSGLPIWEVVTNLDAERTEIRASAVEPLCTHACCTAPPPA